MAPGHAERGTAKDAKALQQKKKKAKAIGMGDRGGRGRSSRRYSWRSLFAPALEHILKATHRARAQRLASLGAERVALCVMTSWPR